MGSWLAQQQTIVKKRREGSTGQDSLLCRHLLYSGELPYGWQLLTAKSFVQLVSTNVGKHKLFLGGVHNGVGNTALLQTWPETLFSENRTGIKI